MPDNGNHSFNFRVGNRSKHAYALPGHLSARPSRVRTDTQLHCRAGVFTISTTWWRSLHLTLRHRPHPVLPGGFPSGHSAPTSPGAEGSGGRLGGRVPSLRTSCAGSLNSVSGGRTCCCLHRLTWGGELSGGEMTRSIAERPARGTHPGFGPGWWRSSIVLSISVLSLRQLERKSAKSACCTGNWCTLGMGVFRYGVPAVLMWCASAIRLRIGEQCGTVQNRDDCGPSSLEGYQAGSGLPHVGNGGSGFARGLRYCAALAPAVRPRTVRTTAHNVPAGALS